MVYARFHPYKLFFDVNLLKKFVSLELTKPHWFPRLGLPGPKKPRCTEFICKVYNDV